MTRSEPSSRAFARIEVRVPARVRVLVPAEARILAERFCVEPTYYEKLSIEHPGKQGHASWERLALFNAMERLERLEVQIGKIADALSVDLSESELWLKGETVSLSGSGAGVWLPQKLEEDTPVVLELTLLGEPTGVVRLLGHVVTLVHPDGEKLPVGRYHLGIAFDAYHKDDREAVVRYTFARQRAQIREMRTEG